MEQELTKRYYRIAQVSEMLSVAPSALRYWEQEFPQLKPKRNDRGTRYYTPADIDLLRRIKFLLHDRGLKIDAARVQLRQASATVASRVQTLERLQEIRARLVELRDALHRLR